MLSKGLFAAAIALAASVSTAGAQDLSDEEILNRFMIQRDAYAAVRSGKGATRGLTIVTVDDLEGSAPAVDVADNGPEMAAVKRRGDRFGRDCRNRDCARNDRQRRSA